MLERLDRLRGDAAAQKPLHPRLCVRALGAKCASTLEELRRLAEQRRNNGAPLAGGGLSEVFDVQRLALEGEPGSPHASSKFKLKICD